MLSTGLMIALAIEYAVIALAAVLVDRQANWPRALYFVGAILISVAIIWMGQKR